MFAILLLIAVIVLLLIYIRGYTDRNKVQIEERIDEQMAKANKEENPTHRNL